MLRGAQNDTAWCDELAKWKHLEATFDNLQLGLRLGARPQQAITTTPRTKKGLKAIMARSDTVITRGSTHDNRDNLAPAFFQRQLCALDGIYVPQGAPWGFRNISNGKRYIAVSVQSWQGNPLAAIPLNQYENRIFSAGLSWPGGDPSRLDHAQTGWPLDGTHKTTTCNKCHDKVNEMAVVYHAEPWS